MGHGRRRRWSEHLTGGYSSGNLVEIRQCLGWSGGVCERVSKGVGCERVGWVSEGVVGGLRGCE